MQKQGKSRKGLIVGIVAAVVVLAAVLVLLLTQCTGGETAATTAPSTTTAPQEVPTYELYWNLDRAEYDGKSEAGMSSRMPEEDGYFHVRFILDGQEITLKVQDRKIINKIDVMDLMGLEIDENGIVTDCISINDMPLEKVAWQFYVQSAGGKLIKANSSDSFGGMEVQLEGSENTGVYDMTGKSGPVGCEATPIAYDRIYAVKNLAGEVTHVFIYERENYMITHEAECQHCEKTVTWYEWTRENKLPTTSGHYQLMNDITLTGQQSMSEQDQKICLDLNGKRVDGKSGTRMYSLHNVGAALAIMDTSEGQTGVLAAHGTVSAQGVVVWVRYGQFHLYSGTLDGSDATTKYYGTTVTVPKNAYFYMHGGTLIGGTATWTQNAETGAYARGYGGTMYVGGKFVMNGGEIRDGFAKSVTYKKNGTSTTTRGYGGNLFIAGGAEVELNGGVIKNGVAGSAGGNIYLDGACNVTLNGTQVLYGKITGKGKNGGSIYIGSKGTFNMNGGCISGGLSYNAGGNVYVNGKFTMTGGYIKGGRCYNYTTRKVNETSVNYNVFVVNGQFIMYGGRIYGGVGVTSTTKPVYAYLSGNAMIKSDVEGAKNMTLNTGGDIKLRVGDMSDKAIIGVNTARGVFTLATKEANTDNFFSDIPEAEVIYTEEGLALGRMNCVCGKTDTHINGCDGTVYLWSPWISASSLPKTNGNYYFIKDVTTTAQTVVTKGNTVRLDLNGYNASYKVPATSSDGYRLYRSAFESLLVITDTTDNPGTMRSVMATEAEVLAAVQAKVDAGTYTQADADKRIAAQKAGNFGQVLWARGGDIIVHNGILDGSNLKGSKSGMTVYVAANTASEDGGVTRKGSFTMYGGTIKGATSTSYGCSLYSSSNGIVNIHGGVIEGGTSTGNSGGNVYTLGQFTMDGGIIRDGKAYSSGGNLVIDGAKANATITGTAQILNGEAGDPTLEKDIGRGGNIRVVTKGAHLTLSGDAVVSGGRVYRSASSKGGYGGNISVNTDTTMLMTGGTVEGGVSDYRAGNIDVCGSLTIEGGTITGGKARYGGNIYVLNGTGRELTMTGGLIEKGHATYAGGNIQALAPVTITGGEIAEGKAALDSGAPSANNMGGNIYTCSELNISGDTVIRDGYSGSYGGNIQLYVDGSLKGNATISGNAQILNGIADAQRVDQFDGGYGGNIRANSNTTLIIKDNVLLSGGQAIGGKYNSTTKKGGGGQGGNLYMISADVQILGGVIENGTANGGGGNIGASSASGTLLLQDVIIRDGDTGTSNGGNIRLRNGMEQLTITGSTQILGGTAGQGGNIYIDGTSVANVLIGGQALVAGGNVGTDGNGPTIYMGAKAHVTITDDAVINATESVGKRGGAVYMYSNDASLTVDGNAALLGSNDAALTHGTVGYLRSDVTIGGNAQLIAGKKATYGGAIYYYTGTMTLKDNAVVNAIDNTSSNGSAIFLYQAGATLKVQDNVEINGGETTSSGAAIYFDAKGTLDISGGKIYGGKTAKSGGAVYTIGKVTMSGGTVYGGEAAYGGAMYIYSSGSLTMTGGEIIGGKASKSGGALAIEANASPATLTITGGSITGGTADSNGGNVWLYSNKDAAQANATITGVTISDGSAVRGGNIYIGGASTNKVDNTLTLNDATLSGGIATTSSGGNLYIVYSNVTMNGGSIADGINGIDYTSASDKPNGGNVYIGNSASFTMNGGSVTGGKTINTGGNFVVYGDMVMNGGTVSGGAIINNAGEVTSTTSSNANIYAVSGNLTMNGGTVDGRVALYGESFLTLSGDVNLHTQDEVNGDLLLNATTEPITIVGSLGEERLIATIRLNKCGNVFSTATEAGNEKYFASVDESLSVFLNAESKLEIGKTMCICGFKNGKHIGDCDGTEYNWSLWTDTKYLPNTTGYYYLGADLATGGTTAVRANNQKIALDLNGYTIYGTAGSSRIFGTYYEGSYYTGTELTLVNSGDTGLIQGWNKGGTGKTKSENGTILWAASKNTTFNLYNITLDASKNKPTAEKNGMVVSLSGNAAKLNVFDSALLGGTAPKGDAIALHSGKNDQKVRLEGNVTITGTEGSFLYTGGEGNKVDVSKLTSVSAPIAVEGMGVFTTGWDESWKVEDYFVPGTEDIAIVVEGGELAMRPYHCICGATDGNHVEGFCDGAKYVWEPWTGTTNVPTDSGYYYLKGDVTVSKANTISTARKIYIDLNGYNISSAKARVFSTQNANDRTPVVDIVLTNTNKADESVIKVTGNGDQGRIVWLSGYNKSLKVYNLTIDVTEATTGVNGLAFSINSQNDTKPDLPVSIEVYNTVFNGPTEASGGIGNVITITRTAGQGQSLKLKDVTFNGGYSYQKSTDGNKPFSGGAVHVAGGDLIMENVTINGAVAGTTGGAVNLGSKAHAVLSGKIVLDGKLADGTASGIYVTAGGTLDVSDLADGSVIGISGDEGVISANTYTEDDADLAYLTADNSEQYLLLVDGKLTLKGKSCICGASVNGGDHVAGFCDGTLVQWQPWSGSKAPTATGNYFLTDNVTFGTTANMSKTDGDIVIDLNGYNITIPASTNVDNAGRMYTTYTSAGSTSKVNVKFTNTTSGTSTIKVEGVGDDGRIMWLTGSNKSLALNNVDIDLTTAITRENVRKDGLGISVAGSGNVLKMFNCDITGGTSTGNGNVLYVGYGNTATMTDCTVTDAKVERGIKSGAASGGYGGFAYIRGTLTLNDCTIKNSSAAMGGGAIYLYGNGADKRAKLVMNGGSIEGSVATGDHAGAIDLQADADTELEGVTIKNCSATWGGAIQVRVGNTLEMTDCDIIGCSATKGAGAIYLYSNTEGSPAKLIMNDCTIDGCTTDGYGGGIVAGYFSSSNPATYTYAELNDTTIKNCAAKGRAGAIHVSNGSEVVLNGCTIEKNTDSSRAAGIYSYQGKLSVFDSSVKDNTTTGSSSKGGGIYLYQCDITLGGTVVIDGNTAAGNASNLFLNNRKVLISEDKPLKSGSSIGLDSGAVTVSNDATYADKAYFHSDKTAYQVIYDDALKLVDATKHIHCVCGGQPTGDPDHECVDIEFTAIDALAGGSKLAEGNYYLTDSVTVSGTSYVGFNADTTVNFCLAGHDITGHNNHRVFYSGSGTANVTFTLTTCGVDGDGSPKGTIRNAYTKESNILGFYHTGDVFNMYNVTLDASESAFPAKCWGNIINNKATFNMYSGTIIGSTSADNLAATGNVAVGAGSVMNMYGGTIMGGTVSGTYATAGNVYVGGTLNMYGGTITGGKVGTDANSYIANMQVIASGTLNMSGGVIDGHVYAGKAGATVNLSGKAKILDADNRSLWIIPGNTNLNIGKMSSGAQVNLIVKDSSDKDATGVIAAGLNDYAITEADLAYFKVTNTNGTQVANLALNDDNTISAVAMN